MAAKLVRVTQLILHYSRVQCGGVQHSRVWPSIIQYTVAQSILAQHKLVQSSILQHSTVQYSTVLYSTGPRCLQGDYFKCTLIATLCHLISLSQYMSCRPCQYRRGLIFGNHHCMHKFSTFTFSLVFQCQYGMVLELDGHLEIGAHVRSNLCYVACLSHLIRSQAVPNPFFSLRKDPFSILRAQHFLSYHSSTMVKILYC